MEDIKNELELPNEFNKLMICLRMSHDSGKSGTIRALAELLMPNPAVANAHWFNPQLTPQEINALPKNISEWEFDICVAVDVRKKHVGLSSHGDYPDIVKDCLESLVKDKCEIIFCACRSRGQTVTEVENIAIKYNYALIMTVPYLLIEPSQLKDKFKAILNMRKAKHLEDFI